MGATRDAGGTNTTRMTSIRVFTKSRWFIVAGRVYECVAEARNGIGVGIYLSLSFSLVVYDVYVCV